METIRVERIEKEIIKRAEIGCLKLNNYQAQLKTRRDDNKVIIQTKDGRILLVDADDPMFNSEEI